MPSMLDGDGEERSAREPDRTVMGPLDQARIRSRHSSADRPHPPRATNQRKSTNRRWASQETSQLWGTRFFESSQPGKMRPYRRSGDHCQPSRSAAVVRWRRIDPDNLRLTPAASAAAPAAGMPLASLLVDAGALLADCICLASMALIGCHEPDAAVTVLVVGPIHKCRHPGAGLLDASARSAPGAMPRIPAGCR
jgi:hypothetical protein